VTTENITLFEALRTQRSVRSFRDEPVPDEAVDRILEAASWAPNAGNRQLWEFIVIRDPEMKRAVGGIYRRAMTMLEESLPARRAAPDPRTQPGAMMSASNNLADTMGQVPVIIVVGFDRSGLPYSTDGAFKGFTAETVYTGVMPAVQNLLLAARGLGLGTCLTTVANLLEGKLKELLGVPPEIQIVALIPLGYPDGKLRDFPPVRRIPAAEKIHRDRW
jgi:nitroreductase